MPESGGCAETVEILNAVFNSPLILNDGHEILARLAAGDEPEDIVIDLNAKFGNPEVGGLIRSLGQSWPRLHLQAVARVVQWALEKLDTEDRVTITWKGDAEYPETVTRFELRGHSLQIEFAHPPGSLPAAATG